MSALAVKVEGVSKQFHIGAHQQTRSFRETLTDAASAPFRRAYGLLRGNAYAAGNLEETIWALRDVSFEVAEGDVIGIVGQNGAGKSTLLKILSQITDPSEGRIQLYGRVGALLEVGTGFHGELTGRENIYLNGAILGMSREEIDRKFDEIVAFAEVEQFIDTPVKHYSSGMELRLGFAVAAHLEPEILIVDEVLAVGDAAFQRKCLGKMDEVAGEGRTVLFVSHNMKAVQRLCNRAVLLEKGRITAQGSALDVTNRYLQEGMGNNRLEWNRTKNPSSKAFLDRICLVGENDNPLEMVTTATDLRVAIEFTVRETSRSLQMGIGFMDASWEQIFGSEVRDSLLAVPEAPGKYRAVVAVPRGILLPRTYGIRVSLWIEGIESLDRVDALNFTVYRDATDLRPDHAGYLAISCQWEVAARDEVADLPLQRGR